MRCSEIAANFAAVIAVAFLLWTEAIATGIFPGILRTPGMWRDAARVPI
jgi:hypothetical protein